MSYGDKLLELQEAMQRLQMLKQIGADRLIIQQEKEIFKLQQEILALDEDVSIDIVDAVLPKKCRFCTEKTTDDERLECFEKNGKDCNHRESNLGMLNTALLRLGLMYVVLMLMLFTFLLLTNILMNYFEEDTLIVFLGAAAGIIAIMVLFRKPVKNVFKMI